MTGGGLYALGGAKTGPQAAAPFFAGPLRAGHLGISPGISGLNEQRQTPGMITISFGSGIEGTYLPVGLEVEGPACGP